MAHPALRTLVQWITLLVVVLLGLGACTAICERSAERKAREFCRAVKIGQSGAGLVEAALTAGAMPSVAKWTRQPGEPPRLLAIFTGVSPLSRHICAIEGDAPVLKADYRYLD